jgi:hypothetical protein
MSDTATTPFPTQASILAELWIDHREDEEFSELVEYNDLGLPLAYAVAENIIEVSDKAKLYIEEAFDLLLAGLEIEDEGFETLEEVLALAKELNQ